MAGVVKFAVIDRLRGLNVKAQRTGKSAAFDRSAGAHCWAEF